MLTVPRVDVGERSFRVHVVPLAHANAAMLLQIEELTEALALETRVQRAESLAQLGSLSAAVAHELRNPLAGIRGAIQVIGATLPDGSPHGPIMGKVEQEVDRLNDLVTDLLAYARPRQPRAEPIDLRATAQRALALLVGDVTPQVEGEGPALADPDLVQQIVLNVCQNALQAGASQVLVQIAPGRIQICDDGPGVSDEAAERIFEAFVTTKTKGTGLGLAISRRAANNMGGWLELVKGPLSGARFVLSLPTPGAEEH